jgi:hypothetical protein
MDMGVKCLFVLLNGNAFLICLLHTNILTSGFTMLVSQLSLRSIVWEQFKLCMIF